MSAGRFKLLGCGVAAGVVQGLHLVHDTQLVAGRHRFALDPENYVLGAFFHYLDILQLFLAILMVISGTNQCLK